MYTKQQNDLIDNIDILRINEDDYYNNIFSNFLSNDDTNNISKSPKLQLSPNNNNTKIKNSLKLDKGLAPRETFQDAFKELEKTFNDFVKQLGDNIGNSNFNFTYFFNEKMHICNINNATNNFLKTAKIINHTHKQFMDIKSEQNVKENILIDEISDRESTNSNTNKNIDLKFISQINTNEMQNEIETKLKKENKLLGNKRKLKNNNENEKIWNKIKFILDKIKYLKNNVFLDKGIQDNGNDKIYVTIKDLYEKNETIIVGGENLAIIYFMYGKINKIFLCQKAQFLEDESKIENALINIKKITKKTYFGIWRKCKQMNRKKI